MPVIEWRARTTEHIISVCTRWRGSRRDRCIPPLQAVSFVFSSRASAQQFAVFRLCYIYILSYFIRKWAARARDSCVSRHPKTQMQRKTKEINCIRSHLHEYQLNTECAHGSVERKSGARQLIRQVVLVRRNPANIICRTRIHCGFALILFFKLNTKRSWQWLSAERSQAPIFGRPQRNEIHPTSNVKCAIRYVCSIYDLPFHNFLIKLSVRWVGCWHCANDTD